jgi:hypothetical protein
VPPERFSVAPTCSKGLKMAGNSRSEMPTRCRARKN